MTLTSAKNSYSILIRDGMLDRVKKHPFFKNDFKRFARSKQLQVQPEQLPYVGVYIVDEQMTPDGDANAGVIKFVHALRIGFSVMVKNNDENNAENKLDEAFWSILTAIFTDPTLYHNDTARIEGFSRVTRRHMYGSSALNNSIPFGELQLELTVTYRTDWPPPITDDFSVYHLEVDPPKVEDQTSIDHIIVQYDPSQSYDSSQD